MECPNKLIISAKCEPLKCMSKLHFQRTSFHKVVFLGPEYLNTILGTNSHMKGTCIAANFESNGPLVWCLLRIKSGWGISIPVIPEVEKLAILYISIKYWLKVLAYNAWAKSIY